MIQTFEHAFEQLMKFEGGYSNDPKDRGGATRYGVTEAVARKHGWAGDMKDFPIESAQDIYRSSYWDACQCDEMPAPLRYPLFDAAVNSGVKRSAQWLQTALLPYFETIQSDGVIGAQTKYAVMNLISFQTEVVRQNMLAQRLLFLTTLDTWPRFGRGWSVRIAEILAMV